MPTEHSNMDKPEKKFNFIQQHIVPKKKNTLKKSLYTLIFTIFLAIIFGFISRAVFRLSEPLFNRIFGIPDKKDIVSFPTVPPEDVDSNPVKPEPAPETIIIERPVELDMTAYVELYSQIKEVAAEINRSIVTVTSVVKGLDWFENIYEAKDVTSGLILENTGEKVYILVSNSKIKDASNIKVTINNNVTLPAKLHNHDSDLDLAVLVLDTESIPEAERKNMKEADLGESYTTAVGDPVIALGSPNGYAYSMDIGFVSGKFNYSYVIDNRIELFNTNMNDNSRGAGIISNMQGEVIGIITQNFKENANKGINTNFAISKLKSIIEDLVNKRERIYFGVIGADMSEDILKSYKVESGIYITGVEADSPAFKAGIQNGDIIMKIEDSNVNNVVSFHNLLKSYKSKESVNVSVRRTAKKENNDMEFDVVLESKSN